jgi:predicted kinase
VEAVLLVGAQASGKTTFYRRRFGQTHEWINRDTLGSPARERDAVARALASGRPFVLDRTNARAEDRALSIAAAKARGYRVIGYFFRSELKDLLARNNRREGREKIPPAGVVATFKRLQPPTAAEGYDELYEVTLAPGGEFVVRPLPAEDAPLSPGGGRADPRH